MNCVLGGCHLIRLHTRSSSLPWYQKLPSTIRNLRLNTPSRALRQNVLRLIPIFFTASVVLYHSFGFTSGGEGEILMMTDIWGGY